MSSSDQQYPYPYEPQPPEQLSPEQQRRPSPYWPDGTAGRPDAPQEPGAHAQDGTQTWQAPTWDTRYQPTIHPDDPHQHRPEAEAYGTRQPGPYGHGHGQNHGHGYDYGQNDGYGHGQQPFYGTPQPGPAYQPSGDAGGPWPPHPGPAQGQPQQPYPSAGAPAAAPVHPGAAADTAYLPPQASSGSLPLPPEVPATPAPVPAPAHAAPPSADPAPARPGTDGSGYGAPTTLGNARITDAQRARAEGRSPVIAPGIQPAALTAVLGLLLAGGAAIGAYALLVPVVLLQAVTAAGWFRLNGMWPARQGIALAFAGGLAADVALLAAGREHGPAALLGTLGVWVLLTVVLQLRSHAGADERMYGLMATVVSAALAVLAGGHLAALPDAVVVGGVAVAAATLARALPLPGVVSVAVALLAGGGAGVAVGGLTDFGAGAALLGLAAGGCAVIGLRVASYDYPSRFVHMTAGVALPLAVAAPAVYLLGRALA
ncbi:hypothetical protein [Streptomyces sp. NPDC049916]|uniref:hypothetical protein n=1 Tax=Streptomyces sp. NPDC049916 TaxID=3155156 RepID=UPI00341B7E77